MDDPVKDMEMRVYDAIKRSANVIVSAQMKKSLGKTFSTPQFILILVAVQSTLTYFRSLPGFGASWDAALRSVAQNMVIQTFIGYITESWSSDLALLNLSAALVIIECVPQVTGWIGKDLKSLQTSITYIFSEKISESVNNLGIPLLGKAALSACVSPKSGG